MPSNKILQRFWVLLLSSSLISIGATALIWILCGEKFSLKGDILDINFFNTLCGVFGIVGLIIAFYQIAALRKEQEIITTTSAEIHGKYFKNAALKPISDAAKVLEDLQSLFSSAPTYDKLTLTSFLGRLENVISIFEKLKVQQDGIGCGIIIDCDKCVTLSNNLHGDFTRIIEENSYISLQRQTFAQRITELVAQVAKCEIDIKK